MPKIIAVVGPTASGKSALGVSLAKKLRGEIISADSRQIYKGMAVISRAERGHMVGIKDPRKTYSSGQYTKDAQKIIAQILKRKKVPIIVGGAGFYADALLRGFTLPEVEPNKKLRATLEKKSLVQLLALLKKLDKKSAARVDPQNRVRLIRAIEIAQALGAVPTLIVNTIYDVLWLGVRPNKKDHTGNIRRGVEARLKLGMVREAKKLRALLSPKRYLELGFEFTLLADYLDKKISKKELVGGLVRGERKYAIRQMRWFKRNQDIRWVKNHAEAMRLTKKFLVE